MAALHVHALFEPCPRRCHLAVHCQGSVVRSVLGKTAIWARWAERVRTRCTERAPRSATPMAAGSQFVSMWVVPSTREVLQL